MIHFVNSAVRATRSPRARRAFHALQAVRALPVVLLFCAASIAGADEMPTNQVPDNTVRVGEYWIFYHVYANDVAGPYVPPGANLHLKNNATPYLAYLRRLSTHFAAELTLGIPPLTKTYGKGPATVGSVPYNGVELTSARWFAPSALLEYVFFDDTHKLRPYIGAGVNYVYFYSRQQTPAGDAAVGGPTRVFLPYSVGPAATAGLNYQITSHWSIAASYSASRVTSRFDARTEGVDRTSQISFGPQTAVLAAGFSF
jgi:outer membrane protein